MKKHLFLGLFLSFLFFSCSARVSGSLSEDGSILLSISSSLEPRITSLIRTFTAVGQEDIIIDAEAIALSMYGAPGVSSISLRNTAPAAVDGRVRISNVNDFLSNAHGKGFVNFEQGSNGGKLQVYISRDNSPEILMLLSEEITVYLEALMAPIASGEELSKSEYLELVGDIYNRVISDEILASRFRASIEFPGRITDIKGGRASGRRADFDIPLVDILVLEDPLHIEVAWR